MKKEAHRRKLKKVYPSDAVLQRAMTYDEQDDSEEDDPGMENFHEVEYDEEILPEDVTDMSDQPKVASMMSKLNFATMENILPSFFQQSALRDKILQELGAYHRWMNIVLHPSDNYSRMLRVFALAAQILCAAAFQAALYTYTDEDNGHCAQLPNERACIAEQSDLVPGATKCFWQLKSHTCHFRQPTVSYQMIMIVAGLSAAMSVPIARLMEYVLIKFTIPVIAPAAGAPAQYTIRFKSPREIVKADSAKWRFPTRVPTGDSAGSVSKQVVPVDRDEGYGNNVPSTPMLLKRSDNVFSFNNIGAVVEAYKQPNSNRIHCILFVNAQPTEVELETFSRDMHNYADSLTFLGNSKERERLLRKFNSLESYRF
jgi:hypothetical protein